MFGSLKVSQRKFDEEVIGLEFISTCSFFGLKLLNLTHPNLNPKLSYNIFWFLILGWPQSMHAAMQHHQQLAAAAAAAAAAGNRGHPGGPPGSFLAAAAAQHSAMGLGPLPMSGPSANAPKTLTAQPGVAPPAFRYT